MGADATVRAGLAPFDGRPPTRASTRARALERFDGDAAFLERIAELFRVSAFDQACALVRALEAGDAAAVAHWAHTLKGSLMTMGATPSADRAGSIEAEAAEGRLDGLRPRVMQLVGETTVLLAHFAPDDAAAG